MTIPIFNLSSNKCNVIFPFPFNAEPGYSEMYSICFVKKLILAIGCLFICWEASLLEECIFLALGPFSIMQESSEIFSCMQMKTPLREVFAINETALIRFVALSLLPLSELL